MRLHIIKLSIIIFTFSMLSVLLPNTYVTEPVQGVDKSYLQPLFQQFKQNKAPKISEGFQEEQQVAWQQTLPSKFASPVKFIFFLKNYMNNLLLKRKRTPETDAVAHGLIASELKRVNRMLELSLYGEHCNGVSNRLASPEELNCLASSALTIGMVGKDILLEPSFRKRLSLNSKKVEVATNADYIRGLILYSPQQETSLIDTIPNIQQSVLRSFFTKQALFFGAPHTLNVSGTPTDAMVTDIFSELEKIPLVYTNINVSDAGNLSEESINRIIQFAEKAEDFTVKNVSLTADQSVQLFEKLFIKNPNLKILSLSISSVKGGITRQLPAPINLHPSGKLQNISIFGSGAKDLPISVKDFLKIFLKKLQEQKKLPILYFDDSSITAELSLAIARK